MLKTGLKYILTAVETFLDNVLSAWVYWLWILATNVTEQTLMTQQSPVTKDTIAFLSCFIYFMQPENIVLKDMESKQVKIIDFGTAQDLNKNRNIKAMVGTPEFIGKWREWLLN